MLTPDVSIWWLLIPSALLGIAMSGVWGPISAVTTRNLPMNQAGAGSGVFNTTRQIGAVLGSASISALITGRLAADLPKAPSGAAPTATAGTELPTFLHAGFTQAMSEALLLPAAVAFLGALIVVWWAKPKPPAWGPGPQAARVPLVRRLVPTGEPVGVGAVSAEPASAVAAEPAGVAESAAHGAHAASAPVDAARHGAHAAEPAADARREGEEHHGIHAAPATD
jgi:hypothetical protein